MSVNAALLENEMSIIRDPDDQTRQLKIGAAGQLYVENSSGTYTVVGGAAAVGEEPTANPVGISGVDAHGLKRSVLTDDLGQVRTTEVDEDVVTASATSAAVLFTVEMTNWRSVLLQITSAGTSCTIAYECSNDQVSWNQLFGVFINYNSTSTFGSVGNNSSSATGAMNFPKRAKYFRARVSVYGSGTVSVAYVLSLMEAGSPSGATIWGQVAEGSAAAGNPVTIGVETRTSNKVSVGNGQIVRPIGTVDGKMIVRSHSIPENEWSYAAASGGILNDVTAVTIKAAAGAPYRNYLTSIQLEAEPVTNATEFVIRNGAGGAVLWCIKVPTTGIPLTNFKFENPLKSSSATLLEVVTLTASGAGAVYFNAQGYVAP